MGKHCNKCRHIVDPPEGKKKPHCNHPKAGRVNPVDGKRILYPCEEERALKINSYCRPEGRGWEPCLYGIWKPKPEAKTS